MALNSLRTAAAPLFRWMAATHRCILDANPPTVVRALRQRVPHPSTVGFGTTVTNVIFNKK